FLFFFFQAEDGIRDPLVTGVQTCALPICSLRVAEQDITLTRDAVRLAGEDLRVIQARYRAGIATILDVLTSQTALIQAELDLVSARFTYQVARASLEALLGRDL